MMITIKNIEEKHFPQLISLFEEFSHFEKLPDKMTNTVEKMFKEQEYIHGYIAVNEYDTVVGYVTLFFAYYTWSGKSLYMDDLYVTKDFRKSGIGSQLINKAITFAKENKCGKLKWQVSNWNTPAIEFYKSLGATVDPIESNCELTLT